jgi:hypothetical protein
MCNAVCEKQAQEFQRRHVGLGKRPEAGCIPPAQAQNVQLSLADAALASNEPMRALRALQKLPVGHDTAIRKAYAFEALGRKEESLSEFRTAERSHRPRFRGTAHACADWHAGRIGPQAGSPGPVRSGDLPRQIKYHPGRRHWLPRRLQGNDEVALARFDRARANGQLPPLAAIDAGYTAMRRFENRKAIAYLTEGTDARADGRINIDEQKLFETRRTATTWYSSRTRCWPRTTTIHSQTVPPIRKRRFQATALRS